MSHNLMHKYQNEIWAFLTGTWVGLEIFAMATGRIPPFTEMVHKARGNPPTRLMLYAFWIWATYHLFFEKSDVCQKGFMQWK